MTSIALELPTGCQLFGSHVTHTHVCQEWLIRIVLQYKLTR